jgi:hypothetical protein
MWKRSRFLGVLANLQKATISFIVSVCLSVRKEQFGSHWADISIISIIQSSIKETTFLSKYDKNDG